LAKIIGLDEAKPVEHPEWLKKAGISEFYEKILIDRETVGAEKLLVVYTVIPPGGTTGAAVKHDIEEAAFVLEGELTYIIDGEEFKVGENMAIFIPPGEAHKVINKGSKVAKRLQFIAVK